MNILAESQEHEHQSRPEAGGEPLETGEPIRPFKLVKYFSFTGFIVIMVFTLALTIFISHQAKTITQKKSNDYSRLMADNLNHQVFLQFVIPTAMQYGRIRLRDPDQYNHLDVVVRNILHSFSVKRVNIYDLEGNLTYSTEKELVGGKIADESFHRQAIQGRNTSILLVSTGESWIDLDRVWTLRTLFPFRAEKPLMGAVGDILGVFEIEQDLTADYAEITKFQFYSVAISLGFAGLIFIILRQIISRGERIIQRRNEEQRRLEEKLHHSQRLANLGQMIASVAHEIRNPLGIISSTAEILDGKMKAIDPKNRLSEVIVEESRRLNGIVTEFLDFARPQVTRPISCQLEDILNKNLIFLTPDLEKQEIQVVRDFQVEGPIEADPDLLYRAFLNLFLNAIQAMPEGGVLTVSTSRLDGPSGRKDQDGAVEVIIADTGTGIDSEQVDQLFNPFFTTKNRGTGLGLAIVKNIIDGHKGQVTISLGPEGGTRLTVRLPLTQE